jgi:phosphatidylglycerophosphate synthase
MLASAKAVYLATRKKHDQLFNAYFMRPIAAAAVVVLAKLPVTPNQVTFLSLGIFLGASAIFIAMPTFEGGLVAVGVLELSYMFDCADGMLARYKKIASKEGHLFDFFTDELKAVLLAGALGVRLYRGGGLGPTLASWPAGDPSFLIAGIVAVGVIASATSLTNFVRRPEMSGKETSVEAHYETVDHAPKRSAVGRAVELVKTFLRFLGHYPSHLWLFAIAGRLDVFFWIYVAINLLYLGQGWLGLLIRLGRPMKPQA